MRSGQRGRRMAISAPRRFPRPRLYAGGDLTGRAFAGTAALAATPPRPEGRPGRRRARMWRAGSRIMDDDPLPLTPGKSAEFSPMKHDSYPDAYLRDILVGVRTIAVVGASPRPHRPSHGVMRYLQRQGYRTIPVNPFAAGGTILGEPCYAALADIPLPDTGPIDMVDIFRRSEAAGAVVDEALALGVASGIKAVWMQLGVVDPAAALRAEANGIQVVMNRCPAIEIPRLGLARPAPA